jgi:D,D-heptose 1,7-bisphosphate phosphatase
MKPAIFLDRDGVINENTGFVHKPDDLKILPGVIEAILRMRKLRYRLYLVSNQAGVARGHMTHDDLTAITLRLREYLWTPGAFLDGIYYCIHAPEERCACRKPSPGMIYKAACEEGLDLSRTFFIGDMATDILAARRAGVISILVGTGQPQHYSAALQAGPDRVAADLMEAADCIERYEWDEC